MRYIKYDDANGTLCVKCKQGQHLGPPQYGEGYREPASATGLGIREPEHMIWRCSFCGYPLRSRCAE